VIWVLVFGACAAAGAYVAANTDPFPPGVDDPGARGGPTGSSPSPPPEGEGWRLWVRGSATHTFRVGGTCRTAWAGAVPIAIDAEEVVDGTGSLGLVEGPTCDFPVAQQQTEELGLEVVGIREGGELTLRVGIAGRQPTGSTDLGGFDEIVTVDTITLGPDGRLRGSLRIPDGVGGTIQGSVTYAARCVRGCDG